MKNKITFLLLTAFMATVFVSCDNGKDPIPNTAACFTYLPEENIQVGDSVFFTNCSEDAEMFQWSFGDGATSAEKNPFHQFAEPGNYSVTLIAVNNGVADSILQTVKITADLAYIFNYGDYEGVKGSVTTFDKYADETTNGYYKTVNAYDMVSNVQYAYNYNGNIYFMGNNTDGVSWVDNRTFKQSANAITEGIIKPRYCVGSGDYLYVSCWGGDIWADESVSYIAKVNLNTNNVESKIALPGGPEGMAIANNKLYAALNYKDSVAVVDLSSDAISYIETPAVTSFFVKDNNDNLYVSLVSTFSDFSDKTGLGYINTTTNELESTYLLDGVSTSYVNILSPNADFSKIYVMTTAYDANWNLSGAVSVFDVNSKSYSENIIEGISGLNGIAFNNDKLFAFVAETVTGNGKAMAYKTDGTKEKEYETGIAPFMMLAVE